MTLSNEVAKQIDEAFDFRGHVTVSFTDGKTMEGYLFNRDQQGGKVEQGEEASLSVVDHGLS